MANLTYDPAAPKRATNLSVNTDLLRIARRMKLNLSRELEHRLVELVAAERQRAWLEENREAIDSYNAHIDAHGVFSDGLRTF